MDALGALRSLADAAGCATPFILGSGETKRPHLPAMPRALAARRASGVAQTWDRYRETGALATAEEAAAHVASGGIVAIQPSVVGAIVIDVDHGDWRPIAATHSPAGSHPTRTPGRRHLWYGARGKGRAISRWSMLGASGDACGGGNSLFIWLWRPAAAADAVRAIRSGAGPAPDWIAGRPKGRTAPPSSPSRPGPDRRPAWLRRAERDFAPGRMAAGIDREIARLRAARS